MGVGGYGHAPAVLSPRNEPGTFVQEAGWAPGPIGTSTENFAYSGIRSHDLQSVACLCTDWAIPAHLKYSLIHLPICDFILKWRVRFLTLEWAEII